MKKNNGHQGIICPFTGAFFHNMQTCLLIYVQQISGERLQDHWSSGFPCKTIISHSRCRGRTEGIGPVVVTCRRRTMITGVGNGDEVKTNITTDLEGNDCHHMSRVLRKPDFSLCENKDADQLCSNCTADQHLCFRYLGSTIPPLPLPKISRF